MSGNEEPGTPPDLPEEYADTYRDAYLRALAESPEPAAEPDPIGPEQASTRVWLVVLVVAVLLIVLAFVIGRLVAEDPKAPAKAAAVTTPASHRTTPAARRATAWTGPVRGVPIISAVATCTARPGVDSANHPVSYPVAHTYDNDPTTAWRCDGAAIGERITFTIPPGTTLGAVGLIPGYAKTDPVSGIDRYAENNRITRVRWVLADGVVIVQRLDPNPARRAVQMIRVPATRTARVVLEIRAVRRGARDTTAISSVVLDQTS